jgi:hypothetical protein
MPAPAYPTYWLVIPAERAVEVYAQPGRSGYGMVSRVEEDGRVDTWYGTTIELSTVFA